MYSSDDGPSWDAALIDLEGTGSLVAIAREERLMRDKPDGAVRIDVNWVDLAALALVERAIKQERSLSFLYPVAAGELAILIGAQVLIRRLVTADPRQSIGVVTSDTTALSRAWNELSIRTTGARQSLNEVFPLVRSEPDGKVPGIRKGFRGVIIGPRMDGWPVDLVIADHTGGAVQTADGAPVINVFADPLAPELIELDRAGGLIWGWSDIDLRTGAFPPAPGRSIADSRMVGLAEGGTITIRSCPAETAGTAISRIREDIAAIGESDNAHHRNALRRGLRVAWHHLRTLMTLPCRPSQFDQYAGLPPWAVRSTATFAPELEAWSRSLDGDAAEFARLCAYDIAELRATLNDQNPLEVELRRLSAEGEETLVVVPSRTAARAAVAALGGDVDNLVVGPLRFAPIRRIHREPRHPRVAVVGTLARWEWFQVESGLGEHLEIIVLGNSDARMSMNALKALHETRNTFSDSQHRHAAWQVLVPGREPPSRAATLRSSRTIELVNVNEPAVAESAFDELETIFRGHAPLIDGDAPSEQVAREGESGWEGETLAVKLVGDAGALYVAIDSVVETRRADRLEEKHVSDLQVGDIVLVGRRVSRLGLLEVLEARLTHRPDLVAAKLIIDNLQTSLRSSYQKSGLSQVDLYRRMRQLGCTKTLAAVRNWILPSATMAPRDPEDLEFLNEALGMGFGSEHLTAVRAALQRRRGFRRAAGRALARAAVQASTVQEFAKIDSTTGLSIADLREAVVEFRVERLEASQTTVPVTDLNRIFQE